MNLYAKDEKTGVYEIIRANQQHVLDTEVGLSSESTESAKYVDFAALRPKGSHVEVVFYEAKEFENGDLRARGSADPKVPSTRSGNTNLFWRKTRRR